MRARRASPLLERDRITMKKHLVKTLVCLLLIASICTGCALGVSYDQPGASKPTNRSPSDDDSSSDDAQGATNGLSDLSTPSHPSDPSNETPYTVYVYYNLKPFDPDGESVSVAWHGDEGTTVVELNEDGQANAGVLDGDYAITLIGLPEQYSYDPNACHVTADSRHADILLTDITEPKSGDGGIHSPADKAMYTDYGCYKINYEGTYRVTFTEPGQTFYFEYQPIRSGVYSISSWCNIYDDAINPLLDLLYGSSAFKAFDRTIDGGGACLDGGFTRNFYYELSLTDDAVGRPYSFGIRMDTTTVEYPVTVDFAIRREGDCLSASSVIVTPDMELFDRLPTPPDSNKPYNYADLGTKLFDGKNYRYDEETYRYRVYDEERYPDTDGWGPYLMCDIKNMSESYTTTSLYEANRVQGSLNNYLRLSIWDEETQSYVAHYYTDFIREYYAKKCDANGRCYVTKELQEFLQIYASSHLLWTDNVSPSLGSPEDNGYSATQEDMWLFACGFYEDRS